ncbi:MAG: alpha/beta hydrolase [Acetobacteraceae bacterium]
MGTSDDTGQGPSLEPVTQQFIDSMASQPWQHTVTPDEARALLARLQSVPAGRPSAQIDDITLPAGPTGSVQIRIVRPRDAAGPLPVVIYCHGGGWISGDAGTHDRLIREIAVGAKAALVFVSHDRSPEAQYPVAVEQVYAAMLHVVANAQALDVDAMRLAVVGDGTGGTIAAAVTLMARQRRGPRIELQVLICPVTDAACDTGSYRRFADGPWLTAAAMLRAWEAYLPDPARRGEITAAPFAASLDELANLPDALVIVAENDVARDEGEGYAQKLSDAGVRVTSVRYNGTIHDFVLLNALADTPAARGAIAQIIGALGDAFG